MQGNQCVQQVVPGGPVTWQAVQQGSTMPPETQSKPKRRRGSSARTCASVFQASLGFILIVSGIIVLSVAVSPSGTYPKDTVFTVTEIEVRDRRAWGIWCGALFIIVAAFGLFSRRSQVVIPLYMAFSIFASLLAICGLVSACIQVVHLAVVKSSLGNDSNYFNPCSPDYHVQVLEDSSMDCISDSPHHDATCVTRDEIEKCVEEPPAIEVEPPGLTEKSSAGISIHSNAEFPPAIEVEPPGLTEKSSAGISIHSNAELTRRTLVIHLVFYSIMLICFLTEFVVSIVGASFTCTGLTGCSRKPPQHVVYYQTQTAQVPGQQVLLPPGVQIIPPQQYPVGMPPPAGAPMVQIAPVVQQTSPNPQGEYLIPDVPPAYQPHTTQPEYAYSHEHGASAPPSTPPAYEVPNQGGGEASNQGGGNTGKNDPLYTAVVE